MERAKLYIFSDGAKFFGKSPKEIFEKIYKENIWEGTESVSGIGANKIQTEKIIDEIPNVIKELQVKTIFDIPCGDFNWFKNIDLSSKIYLGGDIVKKIITQNNQNYKRNNVNFIEFNLLKDIQKSMDLVFCRDCLVHFSINDIKRALINIKESNSKYLMTTTFPNEKINTDIITGGWRPINLQKAPFYFKKPLQMINENCSEMDGAFKDKSLGVWEIKDLII